MNHNLITYYEWNLVCSRMAWDQLLLSLGVAELGQQVRE